MVKNTAGQKIGVQMVSASDGSAFTGSVTVSVTGDAGTQATGSVSSGACTHEGNGYHTYAPAQAETNYTLIAFTFTGTGAVPATVQVFTTGFDMTAAQVPANVTQFGGSNLTAASGIPEVKVASIAAAAITATAIASDAIANAKIADGAITAGKIASDAITAAKIADGAIDAATFAAGAIDASAIAADAIGASELAAGAASEIATAVRTELATELGRIDAAITTRAAAALFTGITSVAQWLGLIAGKQTGNSTARTELRATGAGSGTFDETTDSQEALRDRGDAAWADTTPPTAAAIADAVWEEAIADHEGTAGSTAEALADAGGSGASAADIADAVWDEARSGHTTNGTFGQGAASVQGNVTGNVGGNVTGSVGSVASGGITSSSFASGALDAVWSTAARTLTSFGTLASDVWAVATRVLTAGTNIVLAKGTGVTGFNDLSAAQVNAEADTALADAGVTTTVTGRIDAAISTRATPAHVATELGTYDAPTKAELDAGLAALNNLSAAQVLAQVQSALTATVADSVPADGSRPSIAQGIYLLVQFMTEREVNSTTMTVRKPDGSTSLMTFTLNSDTAPTAITRAS